MWVEIKLFIKVEKKDSNYGKYMYIYIYMYITSDAQTIAHHPLTNAQIASQAVEKSQVKSYPFQNSFHMMVWNIPLAKWCGMSLWPV